MESRRSTSGPASFTGSSKTHLLSEQWDWRALRDFIAQGITYHHGSFARSAVKESSICKGFISRWGPEHAERIVRFIFDQHDGTWNGREITFNSFCKASDPYVASQVVAALDR